jgi:SAM-dependent methyltransferase
MSGFSDVDSAGDPEYWLRYLAGVEQAPSMIEVRERTYAALAGRDGLHGRDGLGADVGCGRGRAVGDLTARGLRAVGVDASHSMITSARARFPSCPFVVADAAHLPWPRHRLAWYRSERMLLHLSDPAAALAEAARVLAPGSPVVLADQDLDSMVIASSRPGLTRLLTRAFAGIVVNGQAGTRAGDYLADAGFTEIAVSVIPIVETGLAAALPLIIRPAIRAALAAGSAPEADLAEWLDEQRRRDERGRFLLAMSMFVTTAQRP